MNKRLATFEKLAPLYNDNGGKLLNHHADKKCFFYMRDRQEHTSYYWIKLKGNYIRGYKIQWIHEGNAINTYMCLTIPALLGEEITEPERVKTLLVKRKLSEWREFSQEFKQLTPDLGWWHH